MTKLKEVDSVAEKQTTLVSYINTAKIEQLAKEAKLTKTQKLTIVKTLISE